MNKLKKTAMLLALPFIIGFLMFYVIPFLAVSFNTFISEVQTENEGITDNIIKALENEYYRMALKNTVKFIFISIPLLLVISYLLAFAFRNRNKIFMALIFIPILIPSASVAAIWNSLFDTTSIVPFYIMFIWKNIGLMTFIMTNSLTRIPREIHDTASVDGVGKLNKHRYVYIPYMIPALYFCFLIGLYQSFKIFREIYLIYSSYPPEELYMIGHYIFNKFGKLDYMDVSTGSIVFSLVIAGILTLLFYIGKKAFWGKGKGGLF